jgi:hypothetical protein
MPDLEWSPECQFCSYIVRSPRSTIVEAKDCYTDDDDDLFDDGDEGDEEDIA